MGEVVTFTARIEVPPAPGQVVSAEWDFEGIGTYPDAAELGDPDLGDRVRDRHPRLHQPVWGTYFPALLVRLLLQREGNPRTPFARSLNLSRVRVVVDE